MSIQISKQQHRLVEQHTSCPYRRPTAKDRQQCLCNHRLDRKQQPRRQKYCECKQNNHGDSFASPCTIGANHLLYTIYYPLKAHLCNPTIMSASALAYHKAKSRTISTEKTPKSHHSSPSASALAPVAAGAFPTSNTSTNNTNKDNAPPSKAPSMTTPKADSDTEKPEIETPQSQKPNKQKTGQTPG